LLLTTATTMAPHMLAIMSSWRGRVSQTIWISLWGQLESPQKNYFYGQFAIDIWEGVVFLD